MAMQNNLALPKLLENIIVHLPERDILTNGQRVSLNWKTIIDSSPAIQKKIMFQPVKQSAISPVEFDKGELIISSETPIYPRTTLMNPLLMSQNTKSYGWVDVSPKFSIRIKAMGLFHTPAGCTCPNLRMPAPKLYEQIKANQNPGAARVPS